MKKKINKLALNYYEEKRGWRKVNYKELDKLGIKLVRFEIRKGTRQKFEFKFVSKKYIPKDNEKIIKRTPHKYYLRKRKLIIELVSKKLNIKIRRFRLENG